MLEIQAFRGLIKKTIIWFYRLPIFKALRDWIANRYITILFYHRIEPEAFASHLDFLKKHYVIVPLGDLRDAFLKSGKVLPPRSLVVTFDDGWKSNYELLPVIREYDCPVTIFLTVGLINTNRKIWNFALSPGDRSENNWLKTLPNEEKDRYLKQRFGHYPCKEYEERSMLDHTEIRDMAPYVDFQSHGMFHSILTKCSEKELAFELLESKKRLSQVIKNEVFAIAYPYNRAEKREIEAAMTVGYQLGRTGGRRLNRLSDDPMILKAIGIRSNSTIDDVDKSIAWAQIFEILKIIQGRVRTR